MRQLYSRIALLLVCLSPIALAACQPIQPVAVDDAKAAYCTSLDAYNEAVENLQNLPEGATVEELETAADAVSDAYGELENSAWQLADAQTAVLEESYDVMRDSVDSIDSGTTLGDARAVISDSVATYKETFQEVREVSCGAS